MPRVIVASTRLGLVTALTFACGVPDEDGPLAPPSLEFHESTPHLEVHSDVRICAGDVDRWEGFIMYVESFLGVTMPDGYDIYILDAPTYAELSPCGYPVGGCTIRADQQIFSRAELIHHELVHAVTADLPNKDGFVHEGLAEALSSRTQFGLVRPAIPHAPSSEVDYVTAGHFVRWLLERYGAEPLIEYLEIPKATRADFERIFGADFDMMVLEFYTEAESVYPRLYEQPVPALESDGEGRWSSALIFDCARTDVLGTEDGLQVVREWVVPVSGHYVVWASTEGEIEVRRKTFDVSTINFLQTFSGTEISSSKIEAGTYEVKIEAPAGIETGVIKIWPLVDGVPVSPGDAP